MNSGLKVARMAVVVELFCSFQARFGEQCRGRQRQVVLPRPAACSRHSIEHGCSEQCWMQVRVAIIPGNGAGNVQAANWYGWLQRKLHQPPAVTCVLRNMPDPVRASESKWLPFMANELQCKEDTIIVGHSSGAAAAMRIILVSAYTTDQGDELEASSGYFNRPWDWAAIRANTGFIEQFGSEDDPFLPVSEQLEVAEGTRAVLHMKKDAGHFMCRAFPELLQVIEARVRRLLSGDNATEASTAAEGVVL